MVSQNYGFRFGCPYTKHYFLLGVYIGVSLVRETTICGYGAFIGSWNYVGLRVGFGVFRFGSSSLGVFVFRSHYLERAVEVYQVVPLRYVTINREYVILIGGGFGRGKGLRKTATDKEEFILGSPCKGS